MSLQVELVKPAESELASPAGEQAEQSNTFGSASDREFATESKGEAPTGSRVMQNPTTNNIVWALALAPGEKLTVPFKYVVFAMMLSALSSRPIALKIWMRRCPRRYTITWPEGRSITVA
jgi:hypothetical protein